MEASLVGKKRNNVVLGGNNNIISKKRCFRRTKQYKKPTTMSSTVALQKLFNACKEVFKGPGTVPPPLDVQNLRHILGKSINFDKILFNSYVLEIIDYGFNIDY